LAAASAGCPCVETCISAASPAGSINIKVEGLVGDRPFGRREDHNSQAELRALSENYRRVAGFALSDVSG
jgi:hypothetical protein